MSPSVSCLPLSLPGLEEAEADNEEKGGSPRLGTEKSALSPSFPTAGVWEAERGFNIKQHSEFVITVLEQMYYLLIRSYTCNYKCPENFLLLAGDFI